MLLCIDMSLVLSFPGRTLNLPDCTICSNTLNLVIKSTLLMITDQKFQRKVPTVISTLLLQYRYWGIWSKLSWYLIFSPIPNIYQLVLQRFFVRDKYCVLQTRKHVLWKKPTDTPHRNPLKANHTFKCLAISDNVTSTFNVELKLKNLMAEGLCL